MKFPICVWKHVENVRLFTPSVSIKWFEGTSDGFMMKALKAAQRHQGGQPAFYNDKAFIRTLKNMELPRKTGWTGYRTDVSRHPFLENGILRPKAHG